MHIDGSSVQSMHSPPPVPQENELFNAVQVPLHCSMHPNEHETLPQTPWASQTALPPHGVPQGRMAVESMQTGAPELQEMTPSTQAFGFPEQLPPAVQDTQAPLPLHTRLLPHEVPAARGVVPFTQTGPPLAQEVTPCRQGFGLPEQPAPSLHDTQVPLPLHT